jgi:hypothetical protein
MTRKNEPPLYLDMPFAEALARFGQTDPDEARALAESARQKRPARIKPGGPLERADDPPKLEGSG